MMRAPSLAALRHVLPARPLLFPASRPEWDLGQSIRHLQLCAILYELLVAAAGGEHSVGSDQFVYFDGGKPRKCLAPDGFVKLGVPQTPFETWKTWERGAPELAVEVLSPSDTRERFGWRTKLLRYRSLGVDELFLFDVDAPPGARLRAWDRVHGALVERVVEGELTPCRTLGGAFVVAPAGAWPAALRIAYDQEGKDLLLTDAEGRAMERAQKEAERAQKEAERAQKEAALAEVARLRAELAARSGAE